MAAGNAAELATQIDNLREKLSESQEKNAQLTFALEGWKKAADSRQRDRPVPTLTTVVAEPASRDND